jgi:hypothetical protein
LITTNEGAGDGCKSADPSPACVACPKSCTTVHRGHCAIKLYLYGNHVRQIVVLDLVTKVHALDTLMQMLKKSPKTAFRVTFTMAGTKPAL